MGEPLLIVCQPGAIGLGMPQMQHAGREGAVLAPHAGVQQPDQQIGILLAPAAEARIEAIDAVEIGAPDREIARPRPSQARGRIFRNGPSGRRSNGARRLSPPLNR